MTDTDDLDVFFLASEEFAYGLCLSLDGAGRSFLYKDISVLSVLECEEDKIDCFFETHNEACHLWLGEGDRVAVAYLVNPERDYGTAAAHHIAVAGTADLGFTAVTALGDSNFLLDGFGNSHCIDRIGGLVGRKAYHTFHLVFDSGCEYIVGSHHIGLDCFHWEELAAWHLFEGCSVEYIIHTRHCGAAAFEAAYITDVELDLVRYLRHLCLILVTHVILLFLIA